MHLKCKSSLISLISAVFPVSPPLSFSLPSLPPLFLFLSPSQTKALNEISNEDQRDFPIARRHKGPQAYINNDRSDGENFQLRVNFIIMMILPLEKPFSETLLMFEKYWGKDPHLNCSIPGATAAKGSPFKALCVDRSIIAIPPQKQQQEHCHILL